MIIAVGSTNPAKVGAVEEAWQEFNRTGTVLSASVPSGVSDQPFSDEETIEGAIHRARRAKKALDAAIGIGLEGGVTETPNGLFLCNWGALVDENGRVQLAGGARIPLPDSFRTPLNQGKELGWIMEEYSKSRSRRHLHQQPGETKRNVYPCLQTAFRTIPILQTSFIKRLVFSTSLFMLPVNP
jgi:inosine/xanthosine triphosphatase